LKNELEEAAREGRKSMARLLEEIAEGWLERSRGWGEHDEDQRRRREAAMKFVGAIAGGKARRAETAGSEVRARIARRHGR
jgi:hypothetical protein